jgi:hypothetical protein
VDVEVYTIKDGRVFDGFDAWQQARDHETDLENLEALDALLARDPAEVKAAILAHFNPGGRGDGRWELWMLLDGLSKHLPPSSKEV